jgi:hypothetical protein
MVIDWKKIREQDNGFLKNIGKYLADNKKNPRNPNEMWQNFQQFCLDEAEKHFGLLIEIPEEVVPVRSGDGHILTDSSEILNRWVQYFKSLLNEKSLATDEFELSKPIHVHVDPITAEEVKAAISKIKNGKTFGPDGIPVELWKHLPDVGREWLAELFNKILNDEQMPDDWRNCFLTPMYKEKGDSSECENYRGFVLISHTQKIWERVLSARILPFCKISENQFGFVNDKNNKKAINTFLNLIETSMMEKTDLHAVFMDLEKAFDRIQRALVWEALRSRKIPEIYVKAAIDTYRDCTVQIKLFSSDISCKFPVKVGLHQGSPLSPLLFTIYMDTITADILDPLPWTILYADDILIIKKSREEAELKLLEWNSTLLENGLKICDPKTAYMKFSFNDTQSVGPFETIFLDGIKVRMVNEYNYLGRIISNDLKDIQPKKIKSKKCKPQ